MKAVTWVALLLAIVGGLNWLLVGAFDVDLVAALFGEMSGLSRIVYILVGVAAIYLLSISAKLVRGVDTRTTTSTTAAYNPR